MFSPELISSACFILLAALSADLSKIQVGSITLLTSYTSAPVLAEYNPSTT